MGKRSADTIAQIMTMAVQNLNEAECSCDRTAIDPRLAALQKLLTDRE